MPAIHPSQKAASSVAHAFRNRNGARLTKTVADSLFMPAFGHATAYVPTTSTTTTSLKKPNETKRNFSSVTIHEDDKVREQLKANREVIDYWKAHQSDHHNCEKSECIDYWKDHLNTHVVDNVDDSTSVRHSTKPFGEIVGHRNFSTNNNKVVDYWTNHNDAHFTDYWEENKSDHV